MNIFITGIAGFIGSTTAERFVELGHTVSGCDAFTDYYPVSQKRLNAQHVSEKGVTIHEMDLTKDDVFPLIQNADVIFHFAAQPGISASVPFANFVDNNVYATQKLLEACRALPSLKMFVNIGTSSIYGGNATEPETTIPQPISYYGVTKLAGEQLVLAYQREGIIHACSLRLFSIYGPRERPDKLYPRLIKAILRDEEYPLYEGSEHHVRSYTFVRDAVRGFENVLSHFDVVDGEIFNIGTDQQNTTGEGIALVEEIIGKKAKVNRLPRRPGDQEKTQANIEKAKRLLSYTPEISLREGLTETVAWYKQYIDQLP